MLFRSKGNASVAEPPKINVKPTHGSTSLLDPNLKETKRLYPSASGAEASSHVQSRFVIWLGQSSDNFPARPTFSFGQQVADEIDIPE